MFTDYDSQHFETEKEEPENASYEINRYPDMDKFKLENELLGQSNGNFFQYGLDIWISELYKNKETGKHSILITRDSDELWIVFPFAQG